MQDRKKEDQTDSGWKLKNHSRSYNKANTRVPDAQKLQIIQLRWEKQRESIKSHDEHFTQTC